MQKIIKGPSGYSIVLDRSEVYPDDPGAGTPAMLAGPDGGSATYWCALAHGEIEARSGCVELPHKVFVWLCESEGSVCEYLYG